MAAAGSAHSILPAVINHDNLELDRCSRGPNSERLYEVESRRRGCFQEAVAYFLGRFGQVYARKTFYSGESEKALTTLVQALILSVASSSRRAGECTYRRLLALAGSRRRVLFHAGASGPSWCSRTLVCRGSVCLP